MQALNGAGWSAVSQPSNAVIPLGREAKSLLIVGSRGEGSAAGSVYVEGTSTGLAGEAVTLTIGFPVTARTTSTAALTIAPDGTFDWSRKTNKKVRILATAGGVRSNAVVIPAR